MIKTIKAAFYIVLSAILVLITVCACQATPEDPIVVGKDQEVMLSAAAETVDPAVSLSEQVNAPDIYTVEITPNDKFRLKANAPITIPDVDGMPIIRVKAADFTQQQVDGMIKALFKGQKIYETFEGWTKGEIMDRIVNFNRMKNLEEFANEEDQQMLDQTIDQFEEIYDDAPDERVYTESNGQLEQKEIFDHNENPYANGEHVAYYMGLNIRTNAEDSSVPFCYMNVRNNNDLTQPNADSSGGDFIFRMAMIDYGYINLNEVTNGFGSGTAIPVDENTVIDDPAVLKRLKLTPAEAKQQVEEMLETAGITDMQICGMYLVDNGDIGLNGDEKRDAQNNAYTINLCRYVDNVPCGYSRSFTDVGDTVATYIGSWYYEKFDITVNDDGIIDLSWSSPLEIGDTVVAHAALLPFKKIAQRFEQQIKNSYAFQDDSNNIEVEVYRVSLELMRISEQDSVEKGLLVPVWNFYATESKEVETCMEAIGYDYPWAVMSINAVDGSIISDTEGF